MRKSGLRQRAILSGMPSTISESPYPSEVTALFPNRKPVFAGILLDHKNGSIKLYGKGFLQIFLPASDGLDPSVECAVFLKSIPPSNALSNVWIIR